MALPTLEDRILATLAEAEPGTPGILDAVEAAFDMGIGHLAASVLDAREARMTEERGMAERKEAGRRKMVQAARKRAANKKKQMPKNTKVHKLYGALLKQGKSKSQAARIAQAKTGKSLKTGRKPKGK